MMVRDESYSRSEILRVRWFDSFEYRGPIVREVVLGRDGIVGTPYRPFFSH